MKLKKTEMEPRFQGTKSEGKGRKREQKKERAKERTELGTYIFPVLMMEVPPRRTTPQGTMSCRRVVNNIKRTSI